LDNIDPKAWIAKADGFFIYLHAGSRLRVIHEAHPNWAFGSNATADLAAIGIDPAKRDSEDLAKQFIDRFLDYLSMNNLSELVPALQAEYQREIEERKLAKIRRQVRAI
jgi:hypothetical protein